jgi:hypothetical protein
MTETILKLNRILQGLVSCELEFQPATELSAQEWNSRELALVRVNEEGAPQFLEGESTGAVGFPVNVQGSFAGLAVVRGLQGARSAQLMQLAELLTHVLESSMTRSERGDDLRVIEERIRVLESENGTDKKVVQLRRARLQEELTVDDIPETAEPIDSPVTSTPLLIETKPGFPLQRIALEIHQMSQRWAFLSLESLSPTIFESREELKELGGITIFIEDLTKLSSTQQLRLAEYLSTKPGKDLPQVVAGITEANAKLRADGRLLPRLIDLFCISEINWSEKTGTQVTSEMIEASLRFIIEKTRAVEAVEAPMHALTMNVREIGSTSPTMH